MLLERLNALQHAHPRDWFKQQNGGACLYRVLACLIVRERDLVCTWVHAMARLGDLESRLVDATSRDSLLDLFRSTLAMGIHAEMRYEYVTFANLCDGDLVLRTAAQAMKQAVVQPWDPLEGNVNLGTLRLPDRCVAQLLTTFPDVFCVDGSEVTIDQRDIMHRDYGLLLNRRSLAGRDFGTDFFMVQSTESVAASSHVPLPPDPAPSDAAAAPLLVRRPSNHLPRISLGEWFQRKERYVTEVLWTQLLMWIRRECPSVLLRAPPDFYSRHKLSCLTDLYAAFNAAVNAQAETLVTQLADTMLVATEKKTTPILSATEETTLLMLHAMLVQSAPAEKHSLTNRQLGELTVSLLGPRAPAAHTPATGTASAPVRWAKETTRWRMCRAELVAQVLSMPPHHFHPATLFQCYAQLAFDPDASHDDPAPSTPRPPSRTGNSHSSGMSLRGGWQRLLHILETMYTDATQALCHRTKAALLVFTGTQLNEAQRTNFPDAFVAAVKHGMQSKWVFPDVAIAPRAPTPPARPLARVADMARRHPQP
jgi:hypothetical protein